jgi:hypothetical protein
VHGFEPKRVLDNSAPKQRRLCLSKTTIYVRGWDLDFFVILSRDARFATLLATLSSSVRSRAALGLENLALRHQIGALQRAAKRPTLTPVDRLLWAWLSPIWSDWSSALVIVQLDTVIAWHRKSFRLFWTWKVRRGQPGRPKFRREVRDLIRRMCRENPTWGAPRIRGELLKLGIDIGETSVSQYMVRAGGRSN